ncbi:MAG: hypothetical protein HQM16_10675 [Deltaproteobacteria bacterium]|nr:hypothetical protein [Deltaproteobacteria bacterium]
MMINGTYDIHEKKGEKLLEAMLARAKSSFSLVEAQGQLGLPKNLVVKILSTLRKKNKILLLSKGLYAFFPPAEKKFGFNVARVLDPIMKHWQIPYYVGLLSAADYYGAAHYKPQILQVIIPKKICFRKAKVLGISFHVQKIFPKTGLIRVKTPDGYVFYPTPALLVLDLLAYEKVSGGIDTITLVIKEIMGHFKDKDLQKVALKYPVVAAVQKLGYILERVGAKSSLLIELQDVLKRRGASVIKLSSVLPKKGRFDPRWKIIKNTELEINDI